MKPYIYPANATAAVASSPEYLEAMKRLKVKSAGADEDLAVQVEEGGGVAVEREGVIMVTGTGIGGGAGVRVGKERMAVLDRNREGSLDCESFHLSLKTP